MKKRETFSDHFNLKRTQYDLDFFDCYIDKDTPLFIDPWAIRCGDDEFSANCYQKIQSVFEILISYISNKEREKALDLLDNLHEPSETGLGFSKKGKEGSSVGREKSIAIYNKLVTSKAVKSGLLTDLEDTALHIENIGPDNISDIITNIIRHELIKYTQEQCDLYGVEMVECQTKVFWDETQKDFTQKNKERLLIVNGKKILLVPKRVLRRSLSINYSNFYHKSILEFEQARHYDARTSLCRTLKGKIIAPPFKKTLEEDPRYTLSRELVFDYIDKHSDLLEKYKYEKSTAEFTPITNEGILKTQKRKTDLKKDIEQKIIKLKQIKSGAAEANDYHDHILNCLNTIFNDSKADNYLCAPRKETPINSGRKKIDITFHNSSTKGFFSRLSNYGNLFCAKILFECKNYTDDIENPEYDQMIGRFNNRESTIGYIVCRDIKDKNKALKTCQDFLTNNRGYVFILTDEDIIYLLKSVIEQHRNILIDSFLQKKMDELNSFNLK